MNPPTIPTETIWAALRTIDDPEFGINLVDLGLIYAVTSDEDRVSVTMTLTTEACPSGHWIHEGVKAKLAEIPGVADVQVSLVFTPPWTPALLSATARKALGI